ncbi:YceI family protein [Taibaiella lutea]|uniref:YceI family protein n=1 Tax=Taibaiella lutea TaxID=2608001 RepID=A0A5M6CIJ7_9BACT|nr:YceI family protein [Taibaiella lutea]KAA5534846.1 YceI family protein [Taibaiella lutea]
MRFKNLLLLFWWLLPVIGYSQNTAFLQIRSGHVEFSSDAPLELIKASSNQLQGILDVGKSVFAFKVSIATFAGFNNPLQREHFNENYMETEVFPEATYTGKIIETIDYSKKGIYTIRTKGKLTIHGIAQERIIKAIVNITDSKITVQSDFTVMLADYEIKIPRIVDNNLSKEIKVSVSATFVK